MRVNRVKIFNYKGIKMLLKFATRFASILFGILALIAIVIHFVFSNKLSIDLWIVFFPVILAVPILTKF
jgi:hypothetical protein